MTNPQHLPAGSVPPWTLGDRLRKARVWRGIEIADMAESIGCTPRTISNYELDQTRPPKLVINHMSERPHRIRVTNANGDVVYDGPPDVTWRIVDDSLMTPLPGNITWTGGALLREADEPIHVSWTADGTTVEDGKS